MSINDRRRLLGPSDARAAKVGLGPHLQGKPVRMDPKKPDEIRKMFLKTDLVANANGSAYLEADKNIIQVSVFGPRPIRGSFIDRASFSVECKFLPYAKQPDEAIFNQGLGQANNNGRQGLTTIEHKISSYLETSLLPSLLLEKYPKSTIDVFVTVISSDSSIIPNASMLNLTSWIVNCASLALVDSGIEIKDIVTCGQVRLNCADNSLEFDSPGHLQELAQGSNYIDCVASFMNLKNDELVGIWFDGRQEELTEKSVKTLIKACNEMSVKIRTNINSFLLKQMSD